MMKNHSPNLSPMNEQSLSAVRGGVNTGSSVPTSVKKYQELEAAWVKLGFDQHGWNRRQLEGLCDAWEEQGWPGTAEQWLSKMKTW